MNLSPFGFLRVKVIALAVENLERANRFYGEMLALPSAYEGDEQVGYLLGETGLEGFPSPRPLRLREEKSYPCASVSICG